MGESGWAVTGRLDQTPCGRRYLVRGRGGVSGELVMAGTQRERARLERTAGLLAGFAGGEHGAHLPRLLARGLRGGAALIAERITAPGLDETGPLGSGAVVTAFVPVVELLASAHAAGVTHGAIRPAAIRLDALRGPVLCAWWACAPIAARRGAARAVAADWRALALLLRDAARAAVPDEGAEPYETSLVASECEAALRGAREASPERAARIVDALFEWSPATALPMTKLPAMALPGAASSRAGDP